MIISSSGLSDCRRDIVRTDFTDQHPTSDPSEPGSSCQSRLFATNLGEWFALDPKRQSSPLLWQRRYRPLTLESRSHSSVVVERSYTKEDCLKIMVDKAETIFPLKVSLQREMVQVGLNLVGFCGWWKQNQLTQLQPRNSHQNSSWNYHLIFLGGKREWELPFNVIHFTNNYVPGGVLGSEDPKIKSQACWLGLRCQDGPS